MDRMNHSSMKKILVSAPNWIGDCLMVTPLIRALKDNFPDSDICVISHKRVKDVFQNSPFVNEFIEIGNAIGFFDKLKVIKALSLKKFDTALMLKPSFTKSLLYKLAGIKDIVGFKSKKFTFAGIKVQPLPEGRHKMDCYLHILEGLGIKGCGKTPEFFLSKDDEEKAGEILSQVNKEAHLVILHPKANWPLKMWPEEYFAELADKLIEELSVSLVFTGTKDDLPLIERIESLMKNTPYNFAGRTSLGELAAVLKRADLFISADTGIMHLASALKVPLIAVFGATSPYLNGPRGEGRIKVLFKNKRCKLPCYEFNCQDNTCMKEIKVEDVFNQAREVLEFS